jgi:hypothetical protein
MIQGAMDCRKQAFVSCWLISGEISTIYWTSMSEAEDRHSLYFVFDVFNKRDIV